MNNNERLVNGNRGRNAYFVPILPSPNEQKVFIAEKVDPDFDWPGNQSECDCKSLKGADLWGHGREK